MATRDILRDKSLDHILLDFESLKELPKLSEIVTAFLAGEYKTILKTPISQTLYSKLASTVTLSREKGGDAAIPEGSLNNEVDAILVFISGLAAFHAFLQANVTGPPLDLRDVFTNEGDAKQLRDKCLRSLDVDGISVYQHIPHIELFCLARMVFTVCFPRLISGNFIDSKWMRLRINAYHQRLLSGVSFSRVVDATALQNIIDKDLKDLEEDIFASNSTFSTQAKVQLLLEKAQIHILQGLDIKAKEDVKNASETSGFNFALSGALGKRTKFQQTDISQLVVFAKSKDSSEATLKSDEIENAKGGGVSNGIHKGPENLEHNDDTLLESISFTKPKSDAVDNLPPSLAGMAPDQQPQLTPLDQITLLTEATIKDTFLPLDKLNSEEVLPYAVRVLNDKPTNWQIYTQALLVRSRIESHRSRTQERSVLQLQVIVDQIIADTTEEPSPSSDGVPEFRVTSFLPRAKASESAPIGERLQYIFQLNTPTRWEIETELAFAWSGAGSLVSALEIFKRLKLWPEVALCYHSVGQEDKARQVVRRQLYFSEKGPEMDVYDIDAEAIATEKWSGEIRTPPPPHSPRLWCILGDLDNDPACWQRAWEISRHRYARAQRTLGEYYSRQGDLEHARESYLAATVVNRQNNETWSRLGDIDLKVGNWDGAIIAFQQSIMIDDSDAKTFSNLGSALLSKHAELTSLEQLSTAAGESTSASLMTDEEITSTTTKTSPKDILRQSLSAYKRAASLAHSNWQIWDNVLTIASRMKPPAYPEILLALRNVIRIRSPSLGENAIDIDVLRALVGEVISREHNNPTSTSSSSIYEPPRGSLARAVIQFYIEDIEPLITTRSSLYLLGEKLALYTRDYPRALGCAEKAWRMTTQAGDEKWLTDVERWREVVEVTDGLVSAYENYGGREWDATGGVVEKGWRMKARSAVRGVMGRGRDSWEGTQEWEQLVGLLEGLKV